MANSVAVIRGPWKNDDQIVSYNEAGGEVGRSTLAVKKKGVKTTEKPRPIILRVVELDVDDETLALSDLREGIDGVCVEKRDEFGKKNIISIVPTPPPTPNRSRSTSSDWTARPPKQTS